MSLTAEQIEARRSKIGCSEIAGIMGLSPFANQTPYKIWMVKSGLADPEDISDRDEVIFGNMLEDDVAEEYARRNKVKVQRVNQSIQCPACEWLIGDPDRKIVGVRRGLECKTTHEMAREGWTDEDDGVPIYYNYQCQGYMLCTGYDSWDLALLRGGNKYRQYRIPANKALQDLIVQAVANFWEGNVLKGVPPGPISLDDAKSRYPVSVEREVFATERIAAIVGEMNFAKAQIKAYTEIKDNSQMWIYDFMGDANTLYVGGDPVLVVANDNTTKFDKAACAEKYPAIIEEFTTRGTQRVMRAAPKPKKGK